MLTKVRHWDGQLKMKQDDRATGLGTVLLSNTR